MRAFVLLLIALLNCPAQELGYRIRAILRSAPEAAQCFWGIRVVDAESGLVKFSQDENKFFVPASNTKLFTTSLALRRLGPDYKFQTRVESDSEPDTQGRVAQIRLIGSGDPNLSGRTLPYNQDQEFGPDALAVIRNLAEQVAAKGIRSVSGDVVGDDSAWVWDPYPPGWAVDDVTFEYGAPVSALTLNDNAIKIDVLPGAETGAPASIALSPAVEFLTIGNRTQTTDAGSTELHVARVPGSRELIVTGAIPRDASAYTTEIAIDDPALFAAYAFRQALEEKGIRVDGGVRSVHKRQGEDAPAWTGVAIATHESAPLSQIVQVINKVSQNLHGEMLLREIARVASGTGSRKDGLKEISDYLTSLGIEEGQWNFEDASGLSRLNLVTPLTISTVLTSMYNSPLRDVWVASLPVGNEDGSLASRFRKARKTARVQPARIHAKTGTLSHVSALSGYAQRFDGRTYAFAIVANNYNGHSADIRAITDKIALELLK